MLTEPTLEKLKILKPRGMARALENQLGSNDYKDMSFEERLGMLVDQEEIDRENRRLKTRLIQAKLRQQASMEDIDYRHPRGLDKSFIKSLARCQWINEHLSISLFSGGNVRDSSALL